MLELDSAAIKGLALAVDWKVAQLTLVTYLKTVHGWLKKYLLLKNTRRIEVHGLGKVVVQHWLQIIKETVTIHPMTVDIIWVPSEKNKSDVLT